MVTKIRICWPRPDRICLEGNCYYCQKRPLRDLKLVREYAKDHGLTFALDCHELRGFANPIA